VEKKLYHQLRKGIQARRARADTADASDHEIRSTRVYGPSLERLTEFQLTQLEDLLIDDGIISEIVRLIGQGKEANVYWVRDMKGKDLALKIFRLHTTSHAEQFGSVHDTGKLQVAESMALKEYLNLSYAEEAGVRTPKLGAREEFIFTMQFLGDTTGPAPLLRNINLVELGYDPVTILEEILDEMYILFNEAQMVHGDFSEHNLIWYNDKVWVIDLLQSTRWHPNYETPERIRKRDALPILEKDVSNILTYFKKTYRQSFELDEVMETMVEEEVEDWSPDTLMGEYYDPEWVNPKNLRR